MIPVTIIYPNDPLGAKVGGPETFLKGFIKYAPLDFSIKYIGINSGSNNDAPGQWRTIKAQGSEFPFFAALHEKDENQKRLVPLSLRFTWRLFTRPVDVSGSVLLFDRIEPVLAFQKSRCPMVGVVHNDIESQNKNEKSESLWSRFPAVYFYFEKRILTSLDAIYSVNENTLKFYRDRYPNQAQKLAFLPTWVDAEVFSPPTVHKVEIRERLKSAHAGLEASAKWILFVGRLQEQKAPLRLVETFHAYHRVEPQSQLLLVAEGNLKSAVKNRVKELNLEGSVFFLGKKTQEELADFYRASDALLLTSNFEGMPRCVLEALGSGLPAVCTDVGEVKLVVKNGFSGQVVPERSPEALSRALQLVLKGADQYTAANCLESIALYRPKTVLEPLYRCMRELYTRSSS